MLVLFPLLLYYCYYSILTFALIISAMHKILYIYQTPNETHTVRGLAADKLQNIIIHFIHYA